MLNGDFLRNNHLKLLYTKWACALLTLDPLIDALAMEGVRTRKLFDMIFSRLNVPIEEKLADGTDILFFWFTLIRSFVSY